jgi:hypothetical protein
VYDDASALPAAPYIPKDPRVQLIRGERNMGPHHGRNVLFQRATSDYVHCLDADDVLMPDWAHSIRQAIAEDLPDIVVTDVDGMRDGKQTSTAMFGLATAGPDLVAVGIEGCLMPAMITYRRALALEVGGFRSREVLPIAEDYEFHIRLAARARKWRPVPRSLVIKRLRSESLSARHALECLTCTSAAAEMLSRELPTKYRQALSEKVATTVGPLYAIGATAEAARAARLARKLGPPRFPDRPLGFRVLARTTTQETAERLGQVYRRLLPAALRERIGYRADVAAKTA